MYLSLRKHTTSGIAAATAGIVTLSLVCVPPKFDAAVTHRIQVHAVQLSAVAASEVNTALANAATTVAPASRPASVPRGAATTGPSAGAPPTHVAAATTTVAGVLGWLRDVVITIAGPVVVTLGVWAFVGIWVVNVAFGFVRCAIVRTPQACGTENLPQATTATASSVAVPPKPAAGSVIHGRGFAVPAAVRDSKTTSVPTTLPTKTTAAVGSHQTAAPTATAVHTGNKTATPAAATNSRTQKAAPSAAATGRGKR
jgi:hypothetical protein